MKYLKYFQKEVERSTYKDSSEFILPNVNYVVESDSVNFNPYVPQKAGDIVYYVNGGLKTIGYADWKTDLGTPVGVIVVPKGFAPDGKARMISLKYATYAGTSSDTKVNIKWGPNITDITLTNYNRVPITDNVGSTTTDSNGYGYLPSDNFSGTASMIDPETKYSRSDYLIPSPYLNGAANPDYYGAIEGYNNALSDFNGLGNTATLVGLGSDYIAANAANNYSDGVSTTKWYLPAMGELGYLVPRFNEINNAIAAVGGIAIPSGDFWSSSECDSGRVYYLSMSIGYINSYGKVNSCYVRPFAIVE